MILRSAELYVIVELRQARLGVVLTPVGTQLTVAVHQLAAVEEIGIFIQTVIIETVGIKCLLPVLKHHVLARLHDLPLTVIPGTDACQRQRVALAEPHMPKRFHGVGTLVEIGAVAIKVCPLVHECHMSFGYLRIRIETSHVIA